MLKILLERVFGGSFMEIRHSDRGFQWHVRWMRSAAGKGLNSADMNKNFNLERHNWWFINVQKSVVRRGLTGFWDDWAFQFRQS